MRNTSIIIALIMISLTTLCQEIKLKVTVDNKCSENQCAIVYIVKDSTMITDYSNVNIKTVINSEIFNLKDTGTYFIFLDLEIYPYHMIQINKAGFYNVNLKLKTVSIHSWISNPPFSEYFYCETKCEGFITDYYPNGQIRIQGTFENGQPTDTITNYYINGNFMNRFYFPKMSKVIRVSEWYYPTGILESRFETYSWGYFYKEFDKYGENILEYSYNKETFTYIYFKNGQPIKKEVRDGRIKYEFEYINDKWIKLETLQNKP